MRVLLGRDELLMSGKGPMTPFRIATCPGPSFRRSAAGLAVTGFGYDDDGTVIWRLRDNEFVLLEGEYLHAHRPDRTSLGLYDKLEREVFYIRYLTPDTVRIRGRFLCGWRPACRRQRQRNRDWCAPAQPTALPERQRRRVELCAESDGTVVLGDGRVWNPSVA